MKKHVFALIAPLAISLSASAMTIDFNELASDQFQDPYSPLSSKTFTFSTTQERFYIWPKNDSRNADLGGATVIGHLKMTMQQASGQVFNFQSIDMDDIYAAPKGQPTGNTSPHPIKFTFQYADGTKSEKTVYLDAIGGMQTFVFNEYNLRSVTWEHTQPYDTASRGSQFDNVNVSLMSCTAH
ncbi:MAG: hypothetical protein KGL57_07015 [Burkholderiales bacterium]|nr:hypothetical protein [Burkholderiales bacterium]